MLEGEPSLVEVPVEEMILAKELLCLEESAVFGVTIHHARNQ
jgi:hypothetical protein